MKINAMCTARPISSGVVPSGMPVSSARPGGVHLAPTHRSLLGQESAWTAGTDVEYFGTDAVPATGPAPRKQFAPLGIRTTSPPV